MSWSLRRALGAVAALVALAVAPAAAQARQAAPRAASASHRITLELPLAVDARGLESFAAAVADPRSPRYGHYATLRQLARRYGASAATRRRVVTYLRHAGATGVGVNPTGLFAAATMRVAQAERLFGTSLSTYHATASGAARATDYLAPSDGDGTLAGIPSDAGATIPRGLRGAVTGVIGLDTRPLSQLMAQRGQAAPKVAPIGSGYATRTGTAAGCPAALTGPGFTPAQYLAAYGYTPMQSAGLAGQGERVALVEIDGFNGADVKAFGACFGLTVPPIRAFGVGIGKPLAPGAEATLDLELLDAAAPGLKEIDVYETQPGAVDVLRALTDPLSARGRQPAVISASLGTCEADIRAAIGTAGIRTVEETLQLAAATGVSVLAASGDSGSTGCLSLSHNPLDRLAVDFPASSPWVTGVGGTNVTLGATNLITAQTTWDDEPSLALAGGGGSSTVFPRPSYQKGFAPGAQRAVPDVSMLADPRPGFEIYCSSCETSTDPDPWQAYGGTSAATPLLAGGLALIDQDLARHHQTNLGFANPLLYSTAASAAGPTAISDVTTGTNDLSAALFGHDLGCCSARTGYDEATGLGSVNLAGFAAVALRRVAKQLTVGLRVPGGQHPLAAAHINATVSCSGECLMVAYAKLTFGSSPATLTVYSSPYELTARRSRTVGIEFSGADRARISAALADHQRVQATVYGAIVDLSGEIDAHTAGQRLVITS